MRTLTSVGGVALALSLALTGCSGDDASPDTGDGDAKKLPSLQVASVFGKPTWGVRHSAGDKAADPLVTPDRLVVLDGDTLRAYDAAGKQTWTGSPAMFTDKARGESNAYPTVRQISSDVVAVADAGRVAGEGIEKASYEARVTLFNLADGSVVKKLTVPGTQTDDPQISASGLAFVVDGTVTGVRSDGSTEKAELTLDEPSSDDATEDVLTIGDTLALRTENGWTVSSWDTTARSPIGKPSTAWIVPVGFEWVYVGWSREMGYLEDPKKASALLRVSDGEKVAEVDCDAGSAGWDAFSSSPNGDYLVQGGLRISSGEPECIGGGEGEKAVKLRAVTDDGRAFGTTTSDELVDVPAEGEPTTLPLDGAKVPVGVMKGAVAVHWDRDTGVITGNPVK